MDEDNSSSGRTSKRGFAAMSQEDRERIASAGGRASSGKFKKGDQRTKDAGRKGGRASSRASPIA